MRTAIYVSVVSSVAILLPELGRAQAKPDDSITLVTVCEILKEPQHFSSKSLAVLGRFSFTDEGWWLAEDDCGYKVVTGNYSWPNIIWLDCCYQPAPNPPSGLLALDKQLLNEKLAEVTKTTQLKVQRNKEKWAVAYGKLEARRELRQPSGQGPNRYWG